MGARQVLTSIGIAAVLGIAPVNAAYANDHAYQAAEALKNHQYERAAEETAACLKKTSTDEQCRTLSRLIQRDGFPVLMKNADVYAQSGEPKKAKEILYTMLKLNTTYAPARSMLEQLAGTQPAANSSDSLPQAPAPSSSPLSPSSSSSSPVASAPSSPTNKDYRRDIKTYLAEKKYGNALAAMLALEEAGGYPDAASFEKARGALKKNVPYAHTTIVLEEIENESEVLGADIELRRAVERVGRKAKGFTLVERAGDLSLEVTVAAMSVEDERRTEFKNAETLGQRNLVLNPKYLEQEAKVAQLNQEYLLAKEREESASNDGLLTSVVGLAFKNKTALIAGLVRAGTAETLLSADKVERRLDEERGTLGDLERYTTSSVSQTIRYPEYTVTRIGSIEVTYALRAPDQQTGVGKTITATESRTDVMRLENREAGVAEDPLELPNKQVFASVVIKQAAGELTDAVQHTLAELRDRALAQNFDAAEDAYEKTEVAARILAVSSDNALVRRAAEHLKIEYHLQQPWLEIWMAVSGN